ncbi:hypothetical protein Dsin_026438 [Dipteronia sinensis]|uniref:xylose isomerase n=1 Tax=Dipteronia sinensis TaxID=43782 RepID=A0AAD9ZZ40_9ROSI|nr:hypothetical protein Dsin_026438 [Dipteronia sinensis]
MATYRVINCQDWMRFNVTFWHTFRGSGADPFGSATKNWPWEDAQVKKTMEVNEEMKVNAHEEDSPGRQEMEMLRNVIAQSLMSACT